MMFRGINRGYFDICFECFGPQEEVVTDHGTFWSPIEMPKEKKVKKK